MVYCTNHSYNLKCVCNFNNHAKASHAEFNKKWFLKLNYFYLNDFQQIIWYKDNNRNRHNCRFLFFVPTVKHQKLCQIKNQETGTKNQLFFRFNLKLWLNLCQYRKTYCPYFLAVIWNRPYNSIGHTSHRKSLSNQEKKIENHQFD